MADQALYRDPNNRAAYTILQQVDDARPLPPDPDVEDNLKTEMKNRFKHDFKTRNSKHFLICYDTTDTFAAQRASLMEKVYDAFQFYFNMSTLRPDFLDKRLVVLLLKDRDDYLAYIKQTEHADFSWTAGFYSQRTNRTCFFDEASGATAASFAKDLTDLKTQIDDLGKQITAANAQGQLGMVHTLTLDRNRANESLAQLNLHIGTQVNLQNNSTTMHEAAHQVAFNLGIQSRLVDYPMWFAEGLACSFEFEDAEGHRGPALQNPGRITVIKTALRDNKLIPIDAFIASDPNDMTNQSVASIEYAEGWALFHYLYKFQRQGMEDYLIAFKSHKALRAISTDQRKVMFTKAFGGNLDELNKKIVVYLKSIPCKPR